MKLEKQTKEFESIKKGAIDMTELGIGVIVLGVAVSIGATILTKMAATQITNAATYVVVNESVSSVTTVGSNLAQGWVKSIDLVINTSGKVITTGNSTLTINTDTGLGTISSSGTNAFNNSNWNVTYTVYNKSDPRFDVPTDAAVGLMEYGNWFKILVIVGIAAVVLAVLFMSFDNRGSSGSSGGTSY